MRLYFACCKDLCTKEKANFHAACSRAHCGTAHEAEDMRGVCGVMAMRGVRATRLVGIERVHARGPRRNHGKRLTGREGKRSPTEFRRNKGSRFVFVLRGKLASFNALLTNPPAICPIEAPGRIKTFKKQLCRLAMCDVYLLSSRSVKIGFPYKMSLYHAWASPESRGEICSRCSRARLRGLPREASRKRLVTPAS